MKKQVKIRMSDKSGITLIALIVTIIIMLILAGVTISVLTGDKGLINNTKDIVVRSQSEQIKEAISIYILNKELENKREVLEKYPVLYDNENNEYITLDTVLSNAEKDNLPVDLKYILLSLSSDPNSTEIPSLEQLDYTKFYKFDTTSFNVPKEWKDDLYICFGNYGYKVINIKGVQYQGNTIYVLVPFNNEAEPQYIPIGSNTYKLYGDGRLRVLGELTNMSGITEEERLYNESFNKLDLKMINESFGNRMALGANGENKKTYISANTVYVIDQNDDLWAWGNNQGNKLGLGHSYLVNEPTKIHSNVKNVWAGVVNTVLITIDNKIWGAGNNSEGALGQGNRDTYNSFVEITIQGVEAENIEKVYCAVSTSLGNVVIKCNEVSGGMCYGAGNNSYGQLGLGNISDRLNFVQLDSELNNISAENIIFNGQYMLVLNDDGMLYGCGYNLSGPLGLGDFVNKTRLTPIYPELQEEIRQINYIDGSHALIKNSEGEILISGYEKNGEIEDRFVKILNFESDVDAIILNKGLISSQGKIYSVDMVNKEVVLESSEYNVTEYVDFLATSAFISNGNIYIRNANLTNIGFKANLRLRNVGENVIFAGGVNSNFITVDKNGKIYENFVENNELQNVKKVLTPGNATYALTNDGHLFAKGSSQAGLWGNLDEKTTYQHITKDGINYIDNIKDIFTISGFSVGLCYVTYDNEVYWAGNYAAFRLPNIIGDLDYGGRINRITLYPKKIESDMLENIEGNIINIELDYCSARSSVNTVLLTDLGEVYVMSNKADTSGLGRAVTSDFEKLVIKDGVKVKQVITSEALCFALLENGEVYAWGYNTYGIMGNGYNIGGVYPTPQKLSLQNIDSISLGSGFALFRAKTGEVYGIGANQYGQLGTGDTISRNEFVRCPMLEE